MGKQGSRRGQSDAGQVCQASWRRRSSLAHSRAGTTATTSSEEGRFGEGYSISEALGPSDRIGPRATAIARAGASPVDCGVTDRRNGAGDDRHNGASFSGAEGTSREV